MSEPMPKHTPQPIIGPDGELIEADPNVDLDAYQDYVDDHFAHQIRSDRRATWLRWGRWVVVLVVTFMVTVAVLLALIAPVTQQQTTGRFIYAPLVLPDANESTHLELAALAAPVQLDWSRDGQHLITRSFNNDLYEWGLSGGLRLLKRDVDSFAQSPDGRSILVAMGNGDLELYYVELNRFTILSNLSTGWTRPKSMVWSPDSRLFAISRGNQIRVVDVASLTVTHSIELDTPLASLQWTANGQALIAASNGQVWQWYIERPAATMLETSLYITQIAPVLRTDGLSADGWVVVNSDSRFTPSLAWVTADFKTVIAQFPSGRDSNVILSRSPQGGLLAVKESHRIVIYNIQSQAEGAVFNMPTGSAAATAIEWSPDGQYIAIGATDGIILWSPGVVPE